MLVSIIIIILLFISYIFIHTIYNISMFKHFKGGYYVKINESRNSENCLEVYVNYVSLQDTDFKVGQLWTRPIGMFYGTISDTRIPRFRELCMREKLSFYIRKILLKTKIIRSIK